MPQLKFGRTCTSLPSPDTCTTRSSASWCTPPHVDDPRGAPGASFSLLAGPRPGIWTTAFCVAESGSPFTPLKRLLPPHRQPPRQSAKGRGRRRHTLASILILLIAWQCSFHVKPASSRLRRTATPAPFKRPRQHVILGSCCPCRKSTRATTIISHKPSGLSTFLMSAHDVVHTEHLELLKVRC